MSVCIQRYFGIEERAQIEASKIEITDVIFNECLSQASSLHELQQYTV